MQNFYVALILWNIEEGNLKYGEMDHYPVKNDGVLPCRSQLKDVLYFLQKLFLYWKIPLSIVN